MRAAFTVLMMSCFLIIPWVSCAELTIQSGQYPRIACTNDCYDFGTIASTSIVEHVYEVENHGGAMLSISRVATGCGCTVAKIEPETVQPGNKAKLKVSFNVQGRSGPQLKAIYVHSNDPDMPILRLAMSGTVNLSLIHI